ncbi:piggyBac transposable element-derived protein 3-like [Spodoptera litura]|uniref:PiggyBac transposable element-derived protein 3-like n=1 Tax=Spodoptera litura TaxID=69820 RepID=A0A9J7EFE6_SPOLT|nr:piggyBac transposable element-derived protein 3-like [Spodoptera litura]
MAASFNPGASARARITDDAIFEQLMDGNLSKIEDFSDNDLDFELNNLFDQLDCEDLCDGDIPNEDEEISHQLSPLICSPVIQPPSTSMPQPSASMTQHPSPTTTQSPLTMQSPSPSLSSTSRRPLHRLRSVNLSSERARSTTSIQERRTVTASRSQGKRSASTPSIRKRIWKQVPFVDKLHNYLPLPTKPVRRPIEYFRDYIDNEFIERICDCTNLYYLRSTGRELKSTSSEIAKLIAIQIIMGCVPYPRLPMYWRAGTRLEIIGGLMSRDRFFTLRNALHVVDSDSPPPTEIVNPLWKVQPMIDQIKRACNKLERVPGFYSIDDQMIPFTGRCQLRQVVKNKPRPVGFKNFVLTTSEGLMLDFDIYRGARTMFGDTNLGLGPSVILHLSKSIPPGSCVYHDRYFTTVPLIEEMNKLNLHSTGTIMLNRIPDRATIKFKTDVQMTRGESQQFVCEPTTIVKWKDNKSVLLASNCTGSSATTLVKRWDKAMKRYVDVTAPNIVRNYNQHMVGVDVLDQQMEYYRTFIKTKKWTLKLLTHFFDLALVNSWRLYRIDCNSNNYARKDTKPLLDFRLNVADALSSTPSRARRHSEDEDEDQSAAPRRKYKIYRPANRPSAEKRYDGYEHFPTSDDIKAPRTCRLETCSSRSKIRC